MKRITLILFFLGIAKLHAQQHDLAFYTSAAHSYSPDLRSNLNLQKFTLIEKDLTRARYKKPRVSLTADYLFAPFFNSNGHFMEITPFPGPDAIGYDAAATNGGLYAAQLNISRSFLTGRFINTENFLTDVQTGLLQQENLQLTHELDKKITDQYISVFLLQQQLSYLKKLADLVGERKKVIGLLVEKGVMQQSDYLLLEIETSSLQLDAGQQQTASRSGLQQLNLLCGIHDTTLYGLVEPELTMTPLLQHFNYEKKYALDSLNLLAQQRIINTRYLPQLDAYGNTGLNSTYAATIPRNFGLSAGVHLAIPIYDGGQKKLYEDQNTLLMQNLREFLRQDQLQTQNNLESIIAQISSTQASLVHLDHLLSTQQSLIGMIRDKVITGQVSVTEYLNAIKDYAVSNQKKIEYQSTLLMLISEYNYLNW